MKTKGVILILLCLFLGAPTYSWAQYDTGQDNQWYQGHQGQWQRQGTEWQWRSTHGDQWFQGRQGAWYRDQNGWQFYDNDGDVYRQGWQWYDRYGRCQGDVHRPRGPR